jgi:hypothetical protein
MRHLRGRQHRAGNVAAKVYSHGEDAVQRHSEVEILRYAA